MKKVNHIASIVLKALAIVVGTTGVLMTVLESAYRDEIFGYYTIQSNILCVLLFCVLLVFECFSGAEGLQKSRVYFVVKLACTMCITVTMLVYNLLLAPTMAGAGFSSVSNTLVHIVMPLLVILDCLIFDRKGQLKWFDPFIWTALPLAYLVYIAIRAAGGGVFHDPSGVYGAPYFFLRTEVLGVAGVIVYCLGIFVAFLILSFAVYALDCLLGKISGKIRGRRVGVTGTPANEASGISEVPPTAVPTAGQPAEPMDIPAAPVASDAPADSADTTETK